jgi:CBS domain-containing protein
MKRARRPVPPGEFTDPDENFDPPAHNDELERSLSQDPVTHIKSRPFTAVGPQTTIEEAMRIMVKKDVACVLVTEGTKLLGVVSERDVLLKVAEKFAKLRGRPVTEIMTAKPVTVYDTDPPGQALNVMAEGGFRHVPILDVDEHIVGVVGPRRVLAYLEPHLRD